MPALHLYRKRLPILIMIVGVILLFAPPTVWSTHLALYGADFIQIHWPRLRFAQDALAQGFLPSWYPREFLGSPFWTNIQSFPWLPNRLLLLLLPGEVAHGVGVTLAALLASTATYLLGRRLNLAAWAAAISGFTFVAGGFFSARVLAGHLVLLEVYFCLPLLLWAVEGIAQASVVRPSHVLILAGATFVTCLSGHPQLPIYALATTGLAILWRVRGRHLLPATIAAATGVGCASFALWPLYQLLQRSTRILPLDRPDNDVAFPWTRLPALVQPWIDGAPTGVAHPTAGFFSNYPNQAFFWDTVCYMGLLPLMVVAAFAVLSLKRRHQPSSAILFLATAAIIALLTSIAPLDRIIASFGLFLRSPARQFYVVSLALALAVGFGLHWLHSLIRYRHSLKMATAVVGLLGVIHITDISNHARAFIRWVPTPLVHPYSPADNTILSVTRGLSSRVAMDVLIPAYWNREVDDIGVYDSLLMSQTYRGLLALGDVPPELNVQTIDGSQLSARALAYASVRYVLTQRERPDLTQLAPGVYEVLNAHPRVDFVPESSAQFLTNEAIISALRDINTDLAKTIFLEHPIAEFVRRPSPGGHELAMLLAQSPPEIRWKRPNSDAMEITYQTPGDGFIRIRESWDPGWKASLDGIEIPVLRADGFVMAFAAPGGQHQLLLTHHTPNLAPGWLMSIASLAILAATCGVLSSTFSRSFDTRPVS